MSDASIKKPWAIYSDYSGVTNLGRNNGGFLSEIDALNELIARAGVEKASLSRKIAVAKRRRARLEKAR